MLVEVTQYHFKNEQWFPSLPPNSEAQLLIGFGDRKLASDPKFRIDIEESFPRAEHIGCTTSGEILADEVYDDTFVLSALFFDNTSIEVNTGDVKAYVNSFEAGRALASKLTQEQLRYVLVISDGQLVNGSELVEGLRASLASHILITGGLAGDGENFSETIVWHNNDVQSGKIILCGFYGDSIRLGHGTLGGWGTFGPQRKITKSQGNVLYELDGQPALELYKRYLGEFSQQLPASSMRFPLSIQLLGEEDSVVRTILSIDEGTNSMTFAGNMPEGATAKLMKANIESLIDGATGAATGAKLVLGDQGAKLALLISCVGRRLVLGQRSFEELEAVVDVLGENCAMCGFYSYGEISPLLESVKCRLHNQTMCITTFSEVR